MPDALKLTRGSGRGLASPLYRVRVKSRVYSPEFLSRDDDDDDDRALKARA